MNPEEQCQPFFSAEYTNELINHFQAVRVASVSLYVFSNESHSFVYSGVTGECNKTHIPGPHAQGFIP